MSDGMLLLIVVAVPIAVTCAAAFGLHFASSPWLVRISNVAIGIQAAAAFIVFVLPQVMGKETRADGQLCPNDEGALGHVQIGIALGSIAVGAIALASSAIAVRRGAATTGRLAAGIGAAALVIAIFASIIATAFCGYQ